MARRFWIAFYAFALVILALAFLAFGFFCILDILLTTGTPFSLPIFLLPALFIAFLLWGTWRLLKRQLAGGNTHDLDLGRSSSSAQLLRGSPDQLQKVNNASRRPIGVTLIALMFLWIGCFGTLVFPIIGLSGGMSMFWHHILGPRIQSANWIEAISYTLDGLWFSLYVIYAVIGFGLWKLKNWARQSVLAIIAVGVTAGIVVAFAFARPILLGISLLGGIAVEFGWIAWYLFRPRVRYAFGAWNRYSITGEWVEPPGLSKRGKQGVGILAVTSISLLFFSAFLCIVAVMKSSDAYKITMSTAQASPCVVSSLGSPIETGWLMTGDIKESGAAGFANLHIPVSGPKGKGILDVQAQKRDGNWRINSLVFTHGPNRSNIVPPESTHGCQ